MKTNLKMLSLALLAGILLVGIILTFMALGAANPVPWFFIAALISIPVLVNWNELRHFAVWKDEYSVGIDVLDDDHRKLLNLINKLQTAVHYQTGDKFEKEALEEVVAYTKYHFEREEGMMEEAGYADLEAHKELHKAMIDKIDEYMQDYEKRGHEVLEDVALFLKCWLVKHINGTDQDYAPILQKKTDTPVT